MLQIFCKKDFRPSR